MLKKTTKFIVSLILILGIVLGAVYFYVKGHKEEVVNFIVNTISKKHNGTVSFDDVTLRSWGNFTNPAFYVKNMVLLDSSESKITRFEAKKVYLNLAVKSLLKKITVQSELKAEKTREVNLFLQYHCAKLVKIISLLY